MSTTVSTSRRMCAPSLAPTRRQRIARSHGCPPQWYSCVRCVSLHISILPVSTYPSVVIVRGVQLHPSSPCRTCVIFWLSSENFFIAVGGARSSVKSRARRPCLPPPSAHQRTRRFCALYWGGDAGGAGRALVLGPAFGGDTGERGAFCVYGGGAPFSMSDGQEEQRSSGSPWRCVSVCLT